MCDHGSQGLKWVGEADRWSMEVGWTYSREHWCQGNNSCDPGVQVLSEWWRVVGVVWMTVRRGVEKDGMKIQGQGFLHEGGYTGIKLMSTRVWSEKSRILGSLPPTAQLWLCGPPYRSHIKVPKPFKNVKIFLRLLLQMFAASMSLSHHSSFSFWYFKHTHCYSFLPFTFYSFVIHFYHHSTVKA